MWPFLGILACVGDTSNHFIYHAMDADADVSCPDYIHRHVLDEPHRAVVGSHLHICAPIKTGCQETAHDTGDCVDCGYGSPHLCEMQVSLLLSRGTKREPARRGGEITENTGRTRGPPARSLPMPECRETETEEWPQNEAKAELPWGDQQ